MAVCLLLQHRHSSGLSSFAIALNAVQRSIVLDGFNVATKQRVLATITEIRFRKSYLLTIMMFHVQIY